MIVASEYPYLEHARHLPLCQVDKSAVLKYNQGWYQTETAMAIELWVSDMEKKNFFAEFDNSSGGSDI